MALRKRTRFILVQSMNNANVTEDNMEPYHITVFRRSTSMPPLSRLSMVEYQRRENREVSTNKLNRLNMHAVKKKSARISRRLSSVFGLTAQTIDEQFDYQEERFRALETFCKLFLRNMTICIEALRESFLTKVKIAEDFEELLLDKVPDLPQQFLRLQRSLLTNAFTEFCSHIETYVVYSMNSLIKLFVIPSNLISKRHKKLLDYDSAQSAYEKMKDQQLKQAKQVFDLSKRTYEVLNNQLLEELPILYENSCEIVSICLKEFLRAHYRLMQQMRRNIEVVLNQTSEQFHWQDILERFLSRTSPANEQLCQLTITAKNFSERLKSLSTTQMSNLYNEEKVTRSYLPSFSSNHLTLSTPIRQDIPLRAPQPLPRAHVRRSSSSYIEGEHEGIYLNEHFSLTSAEGIIESHSYASIDLENSTPSESNEREQIYIALYNFDGTMDGVLSLTVGDRLKILQRLDDDGNEEWWYVEKLNHTGGKGYVPANYIQAI